MAAGAGWQPSFSSASAAKFIAPPPSGLTLEYTRDLHLKMSKKIAQLTKVRRACARGPLLREQRVPKVRGGSVPVGQERVCSYRIMFLCERII